MCSSNACIVQPITLRIHEHFQCLNEKVMFYIRIAHNKRLRDVNIGCAPWLARFCVCPLQKVCSLSLWLAVHSIGRSRVHCSTVHCELITLVCVILSRFSFYALNLSFVPFLPIRLIGLCSVFGATLFVYSSREHLLAAILRLNRVFVHIASDSFPFIQFQKWSRNDQDFRFSVNATTTTAAVAASTEATECVHYNGRLECSVRIIKYAGVQLFVTIIIIIKNTY